MLTNLKMVHHKEAALKRSEGGMIFGAVFSFEVSVSLFNYKKINIPVLLSVLPKRLLEGRRNEGWEKLKSAFQQIIKENILSVRR